jgi:hypothetical protein
MLGSHTFCCVCNNPMYSCVVPAVCGTCWIEEVKKKKEKELGVSDTPVMVDSEEAEVEL